MSDGIVYTPPPTIKAFITDYIPGALFHDWIVGPFGSGKTTGIFMKLVYMAGLQDPGPDGIRRVRAVVVRNTAPMLKDTTLKSWDAWFKDGIAGDMAITDKTFTLRWADVVCEVLFRALDTPDDVSKVLSLEVTFAVVDEFIEIPQAIIDSLGGRCGRYPSKKDGGATNFGMWGASNPSTEDNWWHDHLHDEAITEQIRLFGQFKLGSIKRLREPDEADERNTRYFLQPSGQSDEAENIENLPGGRGYYDNLAKGKAIAWVKQYIDAEWGFSVSQNPVVATFNPSTHVSRLKPEFNPYLPLVIGFDPGLQGLAAAMGQEDLDGVLNVLGELGAVGMGVTRFLTSKLQPYLRQRFPNATVIVAPDPAAANRSQTDERAVVDVIRKVFAVSIETNNQLSKRLDAIESYTTRLTEVGPALRIDREACPTIVRALAGGWRYGMVPKGDTQKPSPDKNSFSHYGDAFGYLCRYYHKSFERNGRRGLTVAAGQAMGQKLTLHRPQYHHT